MNANTIRLRHLLGIATLLNVAFAAYPLHAADIRVEVTGSNIKRIEGEGALPVQVISREEIMQSGATNAMEIMNLISANNSAGNVTLGNVIGATTFSNQTASLRGLGGSSTLVLVNGRRLGTFAGGITGAEGVNLQAIPFSAIERVEVLKDGASAVYGSDAIGGVINFIMKSDFTGADITLYGGTPTRSSSGSNGNQYQVMGTFGTGDLVKDNYNAFVSFNYMESKPLFQNERNFSKTNYIPSINLDTTSGQTFPGYISSGSDATGPIGNPGFPNCAPSIVVGSRCRFDPAAYPGVESLPDTKQLNLFGEAQFRINNDWTLFVTGLYARQDTDFIIQPVPLSDQVATTATPTGASDILLPPTSPFYPHDLAIAHGVDGQPLNVRYRAVDNGNRDTQDINQAWQIVTGVTGTRWDWDWEGTFNYSENTAREQLNGGFPLYSRILPLLNSGTVNLFGPNTPDIVQQILGTNFNGQTFDAKLSGYGINLKGAGDIYKLPAGPLQLAAGVQGGHEHLTQTPNALLQTGDLSGYGGNLLPVDASRTVYAAFAEMNIPIAKGLEGNAAVRYDHYSDFGSTTNPKFSLRWQPMPSLLLRASWGTGFLAPTLYQLYVPPSPGLSQAGVSDPLRCPDPNGPGSENNPDCNTQYTTTIGGNANLQPETSNQTLVGAIWEPVGALSLGADWFYLDLKNLVSQGVPIATILNPGTYPQYANLVTRQATCPGGQPCPITAIDQRFVNLGETRISGIDIDARYTSPQTDWGRFQITMNGTYYIKYDVQQPDGSFAGFVSNAYQAVATGITPRWKSYTAGTWTYGPWSATLGNTYQSSYIDVNLDNDGNLRRVGTLSLWDLQGSYTGFKGWTFTLGAKNLFDTDPPLTNSNLTFQSGYDPSYYDPRARFVYGSIRYVFK